jgi:hypothetical protein
MKEYFVVVVNAQFNIKTSDYSVGNFDNYPTLDQIKDAILSIDGTGTEHSKFRANYARVEKRYNLQEE